MSDSPYFQQLEQQIQHLLTDKKFQEAYEMCKKIIKKHPEEKEFQELKETVEKEIEKENNRAVKAKIKEFKEAETEEKYPEILNELQKLLKRFPKNSNLIRYYNRIQELYQENTTQLKKHFQKENREKFSKLLKEDPDKLLEELFQLEKNNPGNKDVSALATEFRDQLISKRINSHQELINSEKFTAINNFITQLKRVSTKNEQVIELEKNTNFRQFGGQKIGKKEFLYRSIQHLNTLMQLKKYDKALKVANEILEVSPTNPTANKELQVIEKKYFNQTREATIEEIQKSQRANRESYKQDPKLFIKI